MINKTSNTFFLIILYLVIFLIYTSGCSRLKPLAKTNILEPSSDSTAIADFLNNPVKVSILSLPSDTTISQQVAKAEKNKLADQKTTYDTLILIDSLIRTADSLCTHTNYSYAHKMLIDATHIIEKLKEKTDVVVNLFNNYFRQIAEVYTTALPEEYLDSIPANLSSAIFQYQVSQILNTASIFEDDSSLQSMLACEQGIPYNVPIENNHRVHAALYTILNRRHRTLARFLNSAYYYLPFMQDLFTQNNVPTDLCFLPILESGYNPFSYSYAHASGIWQFIPSTGAIFGLRINYWIDERRDPYKATLAAIAYFKKLSNDFNNWHLALAAYNCGERNVSKAIQRAQSSNYWRLKLPRQTMHYVPQFIAYQIIAKNPQCFGFENTTAEIFNPDTVHISEGLDLYIIAKGIGIPYSFLKNINPHLRHHCTPPHIENVTLYLPNGYRQRFKDFYATLSEKDKVVLFRYRIRGGDNLSSISKRFKISITMIKSLNKLKNNYIVAGRYLYIPLTLNKISSGALKADLTQTKT